MNKALYDVSGGSLSNEFGSRKKLGEITFTLMYCDKTEKLKVVLKSVQVTLKPSPTVLGKELFLASTLAMLKNNLRWGEGRKDLTGVKHKSLKNVF